MNENELQWLLTMAKRQFKKIEDPTNVIDKTKALRNLDNLLVTYIDALRAR